MRLGEPASRRPAALAPGGLSGPAVQARPHAVDGPRRSSTPCARPARSTRWTSRPSTAARSSTTPSTASSTSAASRPSPTPGSRTRISTSPSAPRCWSPTPTGSPGTRRSTRSPTSTRSPFPPKTVNVKPSRLGPLKSLFAAYDYCDEHGIGAYGGGQTELSVGRGHIQYLASLFHPDTPNDVAPSGYNDPALPTAPNQPDGSGSLGDRFPLGRVSAHPPDPLPAGRGVVLGDVGGASKRSSG